jgi:Toprim domain
LWALESVYTSPSGGKKMKYDSLREKALANFESLLNFWKIEHRKITNVEYDIIATWRADINFGSVRFNIEKGRGADFAGHSLTPEDFKRIGIGFQKEDFVGFSNGEQAKAGFDVIGLCQRVYNCNSYREAIEYLESDIRELAKRNNFIQPNEESAAIRERELERKRKLTLKYANDIWESCKHHKFENSSGEIYLKSRKIYIPEENMRFHKCITYGPTKQQYPALIFKVQKTPESPLQAIHRIYLSFSGEKAPIDNPKMALASIKDAGIWFGDPNHTLYIAEGPENALSLIVMGARFVVSTIYAANFPNIQIPKYVSTIYLMPDVDNAGMEAYKRALINYKKYEDLGLQVKELLLEKKYKPNGKLYDINDTLMAV